MILKIALCSRSWMETLVTQSDNQPFANPLSMYMQTMLTINIGYRKLELIKIRQGAISNITYINILKIAFCSRSWMETLVTRYDKQLFANPLSTYMKTMLTINIGDRKLGLIEIRQGAISNIIYISILKIAFCSRSWMETLVTRSDNQPFANP